MFKSQIKEVIKIGPKRIAKGPAGRGIIYLPKEYSRLRGKKVFIMIEVLEEEEQ